jgi:hypothetical protein
VSDESKPKPPQQPKPDVSDAFGNPIEFEWRPGEWVVVKRDVLTGKFARFVVIWLIIASVLLLALLVGLAWLFFQTR